MTELEMRPADLRDRVGSMLSDGTALRDLINLDTREVAGRVLNDPQVYRLELRKIFARSWVGVAHETEIPEPGDFVLRHIGEDAVIVTRTADGSVSAVLNVCAHRGMEVCWSDAGNQSQFKCPYHGWVFDGTGKLLGAPFEQEMYGDWDKSQYGLRMARVEIRAGIVFATFDRSGAPLEDWLGDAGWYVDRCKTADMEAMGPPARMLTHANWKVPMDQFAGDSYHSLTTHKSGLEVGLIPVDESMLSDLKKLGVDMVHVSTPQGHGVSCFNPMNATTGSIGTEVDTEDPYNFEDRPLLIELFPQTVLIGGRTISMPDGSPLVSGTLMTMDPKGPNAFNWSSTPLVGKGTSAQTKTFLRRMNQLENALLGADDYEQAPSMQRASRGVLGQDQPMRYNTLMGETRPEHWPGPGTVHSGISRDDCQWRFWQRWFDLITAVDG
jgi:nitrite reductase/ring-hydroxylating ferredoxin subunit